VSKYKLQIHAARRKLHPIFWQTGHMQKEACLPADSWQMGQMQAGEWLS